MAKAIYGSKDFGDGNPREGDYTSRLDKGTELRVLCGYPTCGGQLATVRSFGEFRELVMSPGWLPTKRGYWAEIEWLKKRRLLGFVEPQFRRGYTSGSRDAVTGMPDRSAYQRGAFLRNLPAVAICPKCDHRNRLDAAILNVINEAEYLALWEEFLAQERGSA